MLDDSELINLTLYDDFYINNFSGKNQIPRALNSHKVQNFTRLCLGTQT